jgi:hypothetical protein
MVGGREYYVRLAKRRPPNRPWSVSVDGGLEKSVIESKRIMRRYMHALIDILTSSCHLLSAPLKESFTTALCGRKREKAKGKREPTDIGSDNTRGDPGGTGYKLSLG